MNTDHRSRLTQYAVRLILALTIPLALIGPLLANAASIPDRRFGAVDTFDNPSAATALGAGWTRVQFQWSKLQPNDDGQWNNNFFTDDQLTAELAAGREVVGLIVNTPQWALQDSSVPGVPSGLYLREDDPNNRWATFLRKIVSRYAGRIDHWIIWNEPDIWDPSYPGRTWGGDEKNFFQLQRMAYNVIKATNPNAVVHLSAFTYFWDTNYGRTPFFKRLLDEMQKDPEAAAHHYYFDVASANLYFQPDNVYDLIAWHHAQMIGHGFDKPLWLTETNAAPSRDAAWPVASPRFDITLDEQSNFIIQSFALALAAGTSRIAVYKLADVPGDHAANPEPFGLVREDGSRRPAFTAFQVAANYLAGFTSATLDQRGDYAQVTVKRGDAWTTVAWTRQPSPMTIAVPAHAAQAILIDANGRKQSISAHNGQYTIDLAGATCTGGCFIGGSPRLIVEGSTGVSIAPPRPQTSTNPQATPASPVTTPASPATTTVSATGNVTVTKSRPAATMTRTPTPTRTVTSTATSTAAAIATATSTSTATPTATSTSTSTPTPPPVTTGTSTATRIPPAAVVDPPSGSTAVLMTLGSIISVLLVGYLVVRAIRSSSSGDNS